MKPNKVRIIEDADLGVILDEEKKRQMEEALKKKEAETLKENKDENPSAGPQQ